MSTYLSNWRLWRRHFDSYLPPSSTIPIDSHNVLGNAGIEPDLCLRTPVFRRIDCKHGLVAINPCRSNRIHAGICDKSIRNRKYYHENQSYCNSQQVNFDSSLFTMWLQPPFFSILALHCGHGFACSLIHFRDSESSELFHRINLEHETGSCQYSIQSKQKS